MKWCFYCETNWTYQWRTPMNGFWTSGWAMLFIAFPFLLGAVGLAMSLLLARKASYRRIVGALSGSAWVLQQRHFWGEESFKSRWHQVNMVNGAFLYPAFVIRKGLFDEQEMLDFPTDLRRKMVVSGWISVIAYLWLILAAALLAIRG